LFDLSSSFASEVNVDLEKLKTQALEKKLYSAKYWRLLLHYKKRVFGGFKSEADGKKFFLASNGRKNPKSELIASLEKLFHSSNKYLEKKVEPYYCIFPARYVWLRSELGLPKNQKIEKNCTRFNWWLSQLNPGGATLIFSSFYVNNPASMFGHTLLRLDKKGDRSKHDLLDYAVNYAANPGTQGGFLYALFGLTGVYPGTFSTYPYYWKVQEYGNYESRDIWEYALNLTPEEIQRMVYHLWELGQTYFDYYFIDENCSYHLLSLLNIARPNLDLKSRHNVFVAPSDTVKAVTRQINLVKSVKYRPSRRSRFRQKVELLSVKERAKLKQVLRSREVDTLVKDTSLQDSRKARLLDASLDHVSLELKKKTKQRIPQETSHNTKFVSSSYVQI